MQHHPTPPTIIPSEPRPIIGVLCAVAALTLVVSLGCFIGSLIPSIPPSHGALFTRLLSWDGLWYQNVAQMGYHWVPDGWMLGHFQNVDFFPVWPIIERGWASIFGSTAGSLVSLSFLAGILSINSFHRLASQILRGNIAAATLIYALWPGAYCFVIGYSTGFVNICAFEALLSYSTGKRWSAAIWCGLGTGTAPTIVFLATALCLEELFGFLETKQWESRLHTLPGKIAFGLVSVWGLIGYMIFLTIRFGNPVLFLVAQEAWGQTPPFLTRVGRIFDPLWYFLPIRETIQATMAKIVTPNGAEAVYQLDLDFIAVLLFLGSLRYFAPWRRPGGVPRIIWTSGVATIIGYMWFLATTDQNLTATARLFYPAPILFFAAGAWLYGRSTAGQIGVYLCAVFFLTLQIALVTAGYYMI